MINTFCISNCTSANATPSFKGKTAPITIEGSETKAKVFSDNIDETVYKQIKTICSHPVFKDLPVRIMPDTHAGRGTVVGFTSPIGAKGEIIPSILGNDIGCGMLCTEIDTGGDIDFKKLDEVIRDFISNDKKDPDCILKMAPDDLKKDVESVCEHLNYADTQTQLSRMGTLGGGNHFIEIDCDNSGKKYLVIHTGSRNLGTQTAQKYEYLASKQNPYTATNLSYLTGDAAKQYLKDIKAVQNYAQANRQIIADMIINKMGWQKKGSFECVHNYIDKDNIIRKGAINAGAGKKLIIPLNMKDGAIIAYGKGNPDWNNSAPHGAGRKLSRTQAIKNLNLEDYKKTMKGIYSTSISRETIDEAPQAYKDSRQIEHFIQPAADIVNKIKPVYNFKNTKS